MTIYPSTSLRAGSGAIYEKNLSTSEVTTYYFAGSQRVAMRKGGVPIWFIADQLGSTSLALDASGNEVANSRQKYDAVPRRTVE